jgi:hypothetical protein
MSSEFYAIQAAPTSNSDWFWVGFSSRREKYYASKHFSSELIFQLVNIFVSQNKAIESKVTFVVKQINLCLRKPLYLYNLLILLNMDHNLIIVLLMDSLNFDFPEFSQNENFNLFDSLNPEEIKDMNFDQFRNKTYTSLSDLESDIITNLISHDKEFFAMFKTFEET